MDSHVYLCIYIVLIIIGQVQCCIFLSKQLVHMAYLFVFVLIMVEKMFLLTHPLCGPGWVTVIVGKSVHNQRIERMW